MPTQDILITFVFASVLGIFLTMAARKLKISAIVFLLMGGIAAGPHVLNIIRPHVLGNGLRVIIALAVSIILFEGGLTLRFKDYRLASKEIFGVLSKGVFITWGITTVILKLLFGFNWMFCLLAASLVIVTGPTVISPLLQRVKVTKKLHNILYWEGVLIDPLGVFIALFCYESLVSSKGEDVIFNLFLRFMVGIAMGGISGYTIYLLLKWEWIEDDYKNIFLLSMVILTFAVSDMLATESGLLSVTISGLIVGNKQIPKLNKLIEYKMELKEFLIGLLFILLAANLTIAEFFNYGLPLIITVMLVMFLVRPLNVFVSTYRSELKTNEKIFLSWIAPRGIVAASMASLFAFNLKMQGFLQADFLEAFTYAVIVGTVLIQGITAKWVAKWCRVKQPKPEGWLIVGAHYLGLMIARFLLTKNKPVVLIDLNPKKIKIAKSSGLTAICDNALTLDPETHVELYNIGNVLAITENEDLNGMICQKWHYYSRKLNLFFWSSQKTLSTESYSVGKSIWHDLNMKEVLSLTAATCHEMGMDNKEFNQKTLQAFMQTHSILAYEKKGEIGFGSPADWQGHFQACVIKHQDVGRDLLIKQEWVIFCRDNTLDSVYEKLLQQLHLDNPDLNWQQLLKELIRREEEFISIIGNGIALPHVYSSQVEKSLLMVAKVNPPIELAALKDQIAMVFLLISPENDPADHLNQISRIAKFLLTQGNRNRIMNADSKEKLFEIFEQGI
jgi:NhaP-type Na+/H+ or K+/H+ antiporter/mannitol/fructose-specific phosphotransferase system IIA component (Ntr-type)